jgi:hypothetical protein
MLESVTISIHRLCTAQKISLAVLRCLQRRSELRQLVQWAQRKRLSKPLRLYQNRLLDEEIRLNHYTLQRPRPTLTLRWIFWFYKRLVPAPRYYRRGSAVWYRSAFLTSTHSTTYSVTH